MGGFYFCLNAFLNQIGCWVAAYLYVTYYDGPLKIQFTVIYAFFGVLSGLWLLTTFLFFNSIKREYWQTFYSTETGAENARSYFKSNDDDASRVVIFTTHIALWRSIEEEVKEFTLSCWSRWEAEKPEWFTAGFKASVPDHMMPKESLDELNRISVGGKRRRSSISIAELRKELTFTEPRASLEFE